MRTKRSKRRPRPTVIPMAARTGERLQREILFRSLLAVDRHVAVIDLKDHRRHRSAIDAPAYVAAVVAAFHEPAPCFVAILGLAVDELIAHDLVPFLPWLAARMAHDLCSVVIKVHVAGLRTSFADVLDSTLQGGVVLLPP